MRRGVATIGVTLAVVALLLAFTQPASAVVATVTGPEELESSDEGTFSATIEVREDERIPIEGYNVTISPDERSGSVTAVFDPDGELVRVEARGDAGDQVDLDRLEESIELVDVETSADYGYGYLSGTDERTSEHHAFGYGYGYGYGYGDDGQPSVGFDIRFDSDAFAPGDYSLQVSVDAGTEAFASNRMTFGVLAEQVDATVDVKPETLNVDSSGKWITAYIQLPDGDVSAIDLGSVELNGVAAVNDPAYGFVSDPILVDRDGDGHDELMVKFPRGAVADTLESGDDVAVVVNGSVGDAEFTAEDTLRVIDRNGSTGEDANDVPPSSSDDRQAAPATPADDKRNGSSNAGGNGNGNGDGDDRRGGADNGPPDDRGPPDDDERGGAGNGGNGQERGGGPR